MWEAESDSGPDQGTERQRKLCSLNTSRGNDGENSCTRERGCARGVA